MYVPLSRPNSCPDSLKMCVLLFSKLQGWEQQNDPKTDGRIFMEIGSTKTIRFEVYILFTLLKEGVAFPASESAQKPAPALSFPSHEVGILPGSISFWRCGKVDAGWSAGVPLRNPRVYHELPTKQPS